MPNENIENKSDIISQDAIVHQGSEEISDNSFILKKINSLEQRVENIDKKAGEIKNSIKQSEQKQDKALNFMMFVAGVIIIAFFLSALPIFFDYYRNNYLQEKEHLEESSNMNEAMININFKMEQIDESVKALKNQDTILENKIQSNIIIGQENNNLEKAINNQQIDFETLIACLKNRKYWQYSQCF